MILDKLLTQMIENNVSDMFLRAGAVAKFRISGEVVPLDDIVVYPNEMEEICRQIINFSSSGFDFSSQAEASSEMYKEKIYMGLFEKKNYEGAFFYKKDWRFRAGIFFQKSALAVVIRKIDLNLKAFEENGLPGDILKKLTHEKRGLILLTGITGSGKSTTIATMIEHINQNQPRHILSIEEPIEFTFSDKVALINQREIGRDVESYAEALKQFAMLSPDVIYIGQIRDYETMKAALTAAETGALVFSTIHSVNASQTVERIINFFPPHEQAQVRKQLAELLKGVISQRLIPKKEEKGVVVAYEIMIGCPSIQRLIREDEISQIKRYLEEGKIYGMNSFDQKFFDLVKDGKISAETAMDFSDHPEELRLTITRELDIDLNKAG